MTAQPATCELNQLQPGQQGVFYALLSGKEAMTTRDGRPYYRVSFRDRHREVSFPVWNDSPWYAPCRDQWQPGQFYKLLATYRETEFGPQLDLHNIRPVVPEDEQAGFNPARLVKVASRSGQEMYQELVSLVQQQMSHPQLKQLVLWLLERHREQLIFWPAASRIHHAYLGGWLEHVLSVAYNALFLADKYARAYAGRQPGINRDLVLAGAVLHDIGKLRELQANPAGAEYTPAGHLIGHVLQGRDMVREAAAQVPLDAELLLQLEHIIISHQRLPEWGSPKPPMTLEALLVHHADEIDARVATYYDILEQDTSDSVVTGKKNVLGQRLYKGPGTSGT